MHTPVRRQCLHARPELFRSLVPREAANQNTGVRNYRIVLLVLAPAVVHDMRAKTLFKDDALRWLVR